MSTFKCKMCGGELEINADQTVATCEYCGTQQTLPRLDDDRRANLYDRANHFRRSNEFDKAESIYEKILSEDHTDAESYWSLVLCRYGIEYVEDPVTRKRVPTVNRTQFTSIFDDDNYKSALQYADAYQRGLYEAEAKAINEIQKGILAISQKEEPFDVFICYKETDSNGRRTPDSVLANDLYHQLTQEGFKVFFSRITLEDKLGSAYEPYIFAALNSAKVMVVLGTGSEYFNAVWVKNEWSRYLALIRQGQKKMLIPAYKDMDPYDLPEEFSHLQAQDMSKLGFMQDLIRGIKKIIQADEQKPAEVKETVVTAVNTNIAPLLKRAFMFLEERDWKSADEYCEKVLDIDPENAQAYLGKLMAELKVCGKDRLKERKVTFDDSPNYKKAIRFADNALKEELNSIIAGITSRQNERKNEKIYRNARIKFQEEKYISAAYLFRMIVDYKDSKDFFDEACKKTAEFIQRAPVVRVYGITSKFGKWGFIDETGEMVIEPQFDDAWGFSENGLAKVKVNGKWGFIDETGRMVIEPQFDDAWGFSENGLAKVKVNGKWGFIDETGEMVIAPRFDHIFDFSENGLAGVKVNGKYGFIDETGRMVIEPQFDDAWNFSENGLARVKVNGEWVFIDETGEMVIEPQFDDAPSFSEKGLASVKVNGKWGFADETGSMVIEPRFDDARNFSENGLALVKVNGKYGFIDETGEMVIEPQFDHAGGFSENGLARVEVNGKWGFIDETGSMVIESRFDGADDFSENGLAVVEVNGKWGFIDRTGKMVILPRFNDTRGFAVLSKKSIVEHKQKREEAIIEKEQRRLEEQRRLAEQKCLELEKQRRARVATLRQEQAALRTELANLRGLFTGRRRREIETRLAQIEAEIKRNAV